MAQLNKTIIECIPDFLDYCSQEGLRDNTQENYKKYLEKFFHWLDDSKNSSLLPHQLTSEHIWAYRLYLSRTPTATGKLLSKGTQNYYLIALRAFLGYFVAKDILSLPPDKIALSKPDKSIKKVEFLTEDQISSVLNNIDDKSLIGLRNKAIFNTIISTGFKIRQLTDLNRNSIESLPPESLTYIKEYLEARNDQENALFINYRGSKDRPIRLTSRSIERIIKKYSNDHNFPEFTTPETLRSARIILNWKKQIEIKGLSWIETEELLNKQISWLKENISVMPEAYKNRAGLLSIVTCTDCILRKIAILITAGLVKAEKVSIIDKWPDFSFDSKNVHSIRQGKDWHRNTISTVAQYYIKKSPASQIIFEPVLNYGRADIKITGENGNITYIEIGTVSLFKLWYNLMTMSKINFLLIPNEDFIINIKN